MISFEEKLSNEMNGINPDDAQYEELLHTFNAVLDELIERGLVEFPF